MKPSKKISRSSFLSSVGAVGVLGTIPFLASGCKETAPEHKVYDGTNSDAIIDSLLTRRSIRKYTQQEVPQEKLDTIMKCAIFAPSAKNAQPWEVRVIQNPEILKEINRRHLNYLKNQDKPVSDPENHSVTYQAPVLILIARDLKGSGTLSTLLDLSLIHI